jgi:hypothetical protein
MEEKIEHLNVLKIRKPMADKPGWVLCGWQWLHVSTDGVRADQPHRFIAYRLVMREGKTELDEEILVGQLDDY